MTFNPISPIKASILNLTQGTRTPSSGSCERRITWANDPSTNSPVTVTHDDLGTPAHERSFHEVEGIQRTDILETERSEWGNIGKASLQQHPGLTPYKELFFAYRNPETSQLTLPRQSSQFDSLDALDI